MIAVLGLFALIMIGIYEGFFLTPTEAADIGAAAFLIVLAMGNVSGRDLFTGYLESARTTAMILAIIIAAEIFTNVINFAGLADTLSAWVSDLKVDPYLVVAGIVLIYLILGSVL